jgi:chromosome segregation ATPase
MTTTQNNQKILHLQNGINFVNQQISQYKSLLFTMQQQLKDFEDNKKRMEIEIDEIKKGKK